MNRITCFLIFSTLLFSCQKTLNSGSDYAKKQKEVGSVNDGYSDQSAKDFTGSTSQIKNTNNNLTLTDYLKRLPGVSVKGDDANAEIIIRGVSTLNADPSPLFILNGTSFLVLTQICL